MKWKKLSCALISLLAASATLYGCKSKKAESVTLYLAILPVEQARYQGLLDRFEHESGVNVELVAQQYADVRRALQAEAAAGRGVVDVVELDVYYLREAVPLVEDLTGRVKSWNEYDSIYKGARKAATFGEKVYFIPHRLSWQALVYNARILPKPPSTWDELLDVARSHPGRVGLKAALYEGLTCDLLPFIWQAGGDPLNLTDPATMAAFEFLKKIGPNLNPASVSYKESSILEAQEKQEIIIHMNWPFVISALTAKGLMPGVHRVAPLPAGPAGMATVLGGGYLAVPKVAPHKENAWKLIKYLASAKGQQYLAKNLGWIPVRKEGWAGMGKAVREQFRGFMEMAPYVRSRPAVAHYEEISRVWQQAFRDIVIDRKPVRPTLAKYEEKIKAIAAGGSPQ